MEKFLRSNITARILAIFLAVILWLFVTGDKITRTTPQLKIWDNIPIRVENLHVDYVITEMPSTVSFLTEGLPEDYEGLTIQDFDVSVDLANKGPGNHLVRVQGSAPRGLTLEVIDPEQIRVSIERYIADDFPVELLVIGEPATGWKLVDYDIIPGEVLVGGQESLFEKVYRVVLIVDISGMRLMTSIEASPEAYNEEGKVVEGVLVDPSLLTVRLEFERIVEPDIDDSDE